MNDTLNLAGIGLGLALALAVGYEIAHWIRRMFVLRAANRIADSCSTEALSRTSPFLQQKLERYRRVKLRAGVGSSDVMHAAATELVDEYRLFNLEHR